ncbi:hypothetical protein FSP39_009816 [Pinctada imbricata]|uniref:protein-histidine N-methyltransferase n=1 Tax=Pinctada imbricata TaxID=66713 RepID=A0AA89C396_PINIB|nr:hypothetical protein FSP39_009816 [Pinctada imbricata]
MGKKSKKQKEKVSTTPPGVKELSKNAKRHLTEYTTQLIQACMVQPEPGQKEFEYYLQIHELVEKIRALQTDIKCPILEREKHFGEYLEWLRQNGVDTSRVEIKEFSEDQGGYGLKATKDLEENEPFISVPKKIMITTESAKASVLGPLIANDRILGAMPSVVLALHLINERRTSDSFWGPYINVMPENVSNPLYFTPDDIKLLKGSPAQKKFHVSFQQDANAAKLPIKDCFTFDDYRWAASIVMARQNQIPAKNDSRYDFVLIPMWDMCNHCNGTISTEYDIEKDCLECFAMRSYKKDEQIFMFYGARSNAEFLVHNGFVYPDNELDRTAIKLGISKGDPMFDKKTELLAKLQLPPISIRWGHYFSWRSRRPQDHGVVRLCSSRKR